MPKIVHLITGLNTGGAETALFRLLASTDRAQFPSVVVSLLDEGDLAARIRALKVPVYTLKMGSGLGRSLAAPLRLVQLLHRELPDVLQTWMYHADLLGTVAGKLAGVPTIAWNVRCSQPTLTASPTNPLPVLRVLRRLSSVPDVVVVNAEAGRAFHSSLGYRPQQWRLIPNGFDLDVFRPSKERRTKTRRELGIPEDTPVVGMVARYNVLKDYPTFLRAATLLRRTHPETVFLLAGREIVAANTELTESIARLGLERQVHLLGQCGDLPALYPALDVASLSSIAEAFPNVVGEAMACGVPCAVTDVGDAARLVGDTGKVVPSQAPEALATAWGELLALTPDARARLGARARARIAERFSLAAAVQAYESLYLELVADGHPVAGGHRKLEANG